MNEIKFKIPERPRIEEERLPADVVQTALMLKLLKAIRSIESRVLSLEGAILKTAVQIGTQIVKLSNISLPTTLLDAGGMGCIKSLVIRSSSRNFSISISVDGIVMLDNDFSWFEKISPYVKEIAAFEENGEVVLVISDIKFTNSVKVFAKPVSDKVALKEVYICYDITKS